MSFPNLTECLFIFNIYIRYHQTHFLQSQIWNIEFQSIKINIIHFLLSNFLPCMILTKNNKYHITTFTTFDEWMELITLTTDVTEQLRTQHLLTQWNIELSNAKSTCSDFGIRRRFTGILIPNSQFGSLSSPVIPRKKLDNHYIKPSKRKRFEWWKIIQKIQH